MEKKVKIIYQHLKTKYKYSYNPPFLQPAPTKKKKLPVQIRFKLPFQKNVLFFHCKPLRRENTILTACLQPNVTQPSNCVFKTVHMSTYIYALTSRPFTALRL